MYPCQVRQSTALDYLQALAKKFLPSNVSYDYADNLESICKKVMCLCLYLLFPLLLYFGVGCSVREFFTSFSGYDQCAYGNLWCFIAIELVHENPTIDGEYLYSNWSHYFGGFNQCCCILMVDFANKLQNNSDVSRKEAITKAAAVRLRPVLMTTAAMILGVMPLLLATGAGAVSRFDIGLTIVSGMFIGTLFTLFVALTMYTLKSRHVLLILFSAVVIFDYLYRFLFDITLES